MNNSLSTYQFEFNRWANIELINVCSRLSAEQRTMTHAGVGGDIAYLCAHIVSSEAVYIRHITGTRIWPESFDVYAQPIDKLAALAEQAGQGLIDICESTDLNATHDHYDEEDKGTYTISKWVVLLQALYHGVEHRTQIKMLLTQLGVEHPELAGWNYAEVGKGIFFTPDP